MTSTCQIIIIMHPAISFPLFILFFYVSLLTNLFSKHQTPVNLYHLQSFQACQLVQMNLSPECVGRFWRWPLPHQQNSDVGNELVNMLDEFEPNISSPVLDSTPSYEFGTSCIIKPNQPHPTSVEFSNPNNYEEEGNISSLVLKRLLSLFVVKCKHFLQFIFNLCFITTFDVIVISFCQCKYNNRLFLDL